MILGFKTGPKNFLEGQQIVTDLGASMCEVWFDVTKADTYKEMLPWLQKHNVSLGLHHWGVIDGKIKTNLATQDDYIRNETKKQIRQTIDIGADIGCVYVNIHPGAGATETIDFTHWKQSMLEDNFTLAEAAQKLFLESAQELSEYAKERNVLLTIETLTAREASVNHNRESIYDPGNIQLPVLEQFAERGGWLANDISHTLSHLLLSEKDPATAWAELLAFSNRNATQTRLIHMNVITPPYNGTDSHDGITDADFAKETLPTKQGVIDFLHLFKNRDDVYVVNEPKENPAGNYEALRVLAEGI